MWSGLPILAKAVLIPSGKTPALDLATPSPGGYPPSAVLTSCTPPYLYLLSGHHGGCPSILCEQGGWRASPIFPKAGFGDGLASATEKGPISFRPREVIGPAHPFSKTPGKGGPHLLQQDPRQTGFRVSLQQDSRVLAGTSPVTRLHVSAYFDDVRAASDDHDLQRRW